MKAIGHCAPPAGLVGYMYTGVPIGTPPGAPGMAAPATTGIACACACAAAAGVLAALLVLLTEAPGVGAEGVVGTDEAVVGGPLPGGRKAPATWG